MQYFTVREVGQVLERRAETVMEWLAQGRKMFLIGQRWPGLTGSFPAIVFMWVADVARNR